MGTETFEQYDSEKRTQRERLRWGVVLLALLGFSIFCLRENGIISMDLYRAHIVGGNTATMAKSGIDEDQVQYHVKVLGGDGKILHQFSHGTGDDPQIIEVEAVMQKPIFQGSYAMPFIKDFTMTYVCDFKTKSAPPGYIQGKIQGEVSTKLYGPCSSYKAKALCRENANMRIHTYLTTQAF